MENVRANAKAPVIPPTTWEKRQSKGKIRIGKLSDKDDIKLSEKERKELQDLLNNRLRHYANREDFA